jgi:predicted phosphodiesterase
LRPEAIEARQGSDLIVRAGDIGSIAVIDALSEIAPVFAMRGNVDKGGWATQYMVSKQGYLLINTSSQMRLSREQKPDTKSISSKILSSVDSSISLFRIFSNIV